MMKKLVSLLLILCLVLGVSCTALADTPSFKKQPVDSTTDKGGNLSLSFKGTGFVPNDSSWHFVEPETGKEWTGPQLRDEMKARKVRNFTLTASDGKQKLYLTNVPKFMHGWEVYVVLVGGGKKVESDHIHIWYYGLEKTSTPSTATDIKASEKTEETKTEKKESKEEKKETKESKESKDSKKESKESKDTKASAEKTSVEEIKVEEIPAGPKIITVTAEKVTLYPVDSRGNAIEDQAAESFTFEDVGSVAVRSDEPVKYWTVNGIRIEPDGTNFTSFVLKNITTDLVISAKLQKSSSSDEVDPDSPCQVTCTGCTFTYHKGGLNSVASGTVPSGATIIVYTSDAKAAQQGYSINGGAPEHQGSTSFRLKIEDDTTITIP